MKTTPSIDVHKFERDTDAKFWFYMLSIPATDPQEWANKSGYDLDKSKAFLSQIIKALEGRGLIGQTHAPYMTSVLQDALQKLEA